MAQPVRLNPRIAPRIAEADLVIYAPGTQHSSLFPSYLTPGLSDEIARNLRAVKLLITNIQTDAEIAGSSAVDIIGRAVYYLKEKGRLNLPTPCLITHYLVNDPGQRESEAPYIPLGRLESLEDPRVVRIGHYEDGVSGRHDANKVLLPFVESFLARARRPSVAVWLYDADSPNKVSQALVEMVRAGATDLPASLAVYYGGRSPLDARFTDLLPFRAVWLGAEGPGAACTSASKRRATTTSSSSSVRGCTTARISSTSRRTCRAAGSTPCGVAAGCRCVTFRTRCTSSIGGIGCAA